MRIVHLTSVHPARDNRILYKECRSLARAGHDVTLVVPHAADESLDGVRIRAIPPPANRGARFRRTIWQVWRQAVAEQADVYHFHDPELIPVGILLKASGKRVIYDVHEDLPRQVAHKEWIPRWLRAPCAAACRTIERVAGSVMDGVVAATETIARRFPARKTVTIHNFPELVEPPDSGPPYGARAACAVHASSGLVSIRGAVDMVEAVGLVPEHLQARLLLVGRFSEAGLEGRLRQLAGWRQVEWVGWQPPSRLPELFAQARMGLAVLHDTPNYRDALPTKLYEFMWAGLPIIASDFPAWRAHYESIGCTIFVPPRDPRQLARAMQWLLEHPAQAEEMGRRGRAAVSHHWNWAHEEQRLLEAYRKWAA